MGEPMWITYDGVSGVPELTATELRQIEAAYFPGPAGGQVYSGVKYGTGLVSLAGTTITHQALNFVIQGATTTTGAYVGFEPQATKVLQAAHATLARIDRVWVEVQDHEVDASGQRRSIVVYAPGTPGGAAAALPTTAVLLAEINVPINNTAGAVVNDKRAYYNPPPTVFKASASANFVKPTNPPAKTHLVELRGPGAGGGGVDGAASGDGEGAGGGGGGWVRKRYTDAELAASEPFVIGTGGAGGVGPANGTSGSGPSTFKGLSAGAGSGGASMVAGTGDGGANHGTGGVATGGDVNANGGDGGKGRRLSGKVILNNFGGAAGGPGAGTAEFPNFGAGPGANGKGPGCGGSGAYGTTADQTGGAGITGEIIITSEY